MIKSEGKYTKPHLSFFIQDTVVQKKKMQGWGFEALGHGFVQIYKEVF